MSSYEAGDLIEVSRGESVLRGRVIYIESQYAQKLALPVFPYIDDPDKALFIDALESRGYEVAVIEKAQKLPTEPGWYLDTFGRAFRIANPAGWAWWGNSEPVADPSLLVGPFRRLVVEEVPA